MTDIDLLAIVTRPDFPSGHGPIGDHMGLARFAEARPGLIVRTIVLNSRATRLHIEGDRVAVIQADETPITLDRVKLALYMPVCLEVEETNLATPAADERHPLFAAQQWRPVTEYLEDALSRLTRCVNAPRATRLANNKLIQLEALRGAGFALPGTAISTGFPGRGALASHARLVRKNISEGGWKSPTEFSPARLVGAHEPLDPAPAIWQAPIEADHEFRCYVMGEDVTFVRLERDAAITDVRLTRSGRPQAWVVDVASHWRERMRAAAKALQLDYAVIDAMPAKDGLVILEVNANGVWWFLPDTVANVLEVRFHDFLDRMIAEGGSRR
ncbi:MAG: RimK family alpha-L-glutamate ligase [Hyphomicrobiales bacterium]